LNDFLTSLKCTLISVALFCLSKYSMLYSYQILYRVLDSNTDLMIVINLSSLFTTDSNESCSIFTFDDHLQLSFEKYYGYFIVPSSAISVDQNRNYPS
jgi:hypothetical protein